MFNVETSRGLTTALGYQAAGATEWHFEGDCTSPAVMRLAGRPDKVLVGLGIEPDRAYVGYLHGRCRKCEMCLKHRSRLWAARAVDEIKCANRTWFGTLTVRPDDRVRLAYEAQLRISRGGSDWLTLTESEKFYETCRSISPELTKFIKRTRKNSGVPLRYLLVVEAHKDGFPHFHCLVHESDGPVRKAVLDGAWKLGFSQFRLVKDAGAAWYACKYLSKSALARIRASEQYGQACKDLAARRLIADVNVVRGATLEKPACDEKEIGAPKSYDDIVAVEKGVHHLSINEVRRSSDDGIAEY